MMEARRKKRADGGPSCKTDYVARRRRCTEQSADSSRRSSGAVPLLRVAICGNIANDEVAPIMGPQGPHQAPTCNSPPPCPPPPPSPRATCSSMTTDHDRARFPLRLINVQKKNWIPPFLPPIFSPRFLHRRTYRFPSPPS